MPHAIVLPAAPPLAGLAFRRPQGAADAESFCAIHEARRERDGVDPRSLLEGIPTVEEMRTALAAAQDEPENWLVAQVGPQVAGYTHIISWPEADGTWVYLHLGWTLPAWRGRGIGTAMLHWAEDRIRHLTAQEHPGERAEFAGNASRTETEAAALLLNEGYAVGYLVLEMSLDPRAPLPDLPLPAGLETRPAAPDHYAAMAACIDESYRNEYPDNRFAERFDAADYAASLARPRHDPTLWQVAWAGDQVAGMVLSVVRGDRAEVFEVCVHPNWRRHGLARVLLGRALRGLRERGQDEIRLYTNDNFPTRAQDLYRSVGFRLRKEFPRYRKAWEEGQRTAGS